MTPQIEEYDHLNGSPGFALAARGWADNVATGRGPDEVTLHWSQKTIVASCEGQPVGVIVWERLEGTREAWITLGYVDALHRGRGIYKALHARLVAIARREKLRRVTGGVAWNNEAMRAVAERQGRKPISITYATDIEPDAPSIEATA